MVDWTIVISTISGGVIAGLVGLLSAYVSRYLDRRERHLIEHKDNFKLIERAITGLRNEAWPLHYGAKQLKLRHPEQGISPDLSKYGILGVSLFNPKIGDKPSEIVVVDEDLFRDINNHFRELSDQLSQFEEIIKTDGIEISNLLKEISDKIYSEFYKMDGQVLTWTFDKGEKVKPIDLNGRLEEQEYTGMIFLLVIGENPGSWRNTRSIYQRFNLLEPMQKVADRVIAESGNSVRRMLDLLTKLDTSKENCLKLLGLQKHNLKLRGRCKYARF